MRGQLRLSLAHQAGSLASRLSQMTGRGRGETIAGRVILGIDPSALYKLAADRDIVLVSGTNGKTTTTAFLTRILAEGTDEKVSSSEFGANMRAGIATVLSSKPRNRYVVLECDELYLPEMCEALKPKVVVLLNLSRDQLHRTGEVRKVANLWHKNFTGDEVTFVINRDDPFLEYAVSNAGHVLRITFGGRKHPDAATCPNCSALLDWSEADYLCQCGLGSQPAQIRADQRLSGPGRNAVLAIEAARLMGAVVPVNVQADLTDEAPDRVSTYSVGQRTIATRLAKNPESWRECLSQISAPQVILSVNARGIDGRDTSWLWDVNYSQLLGRRVVCTGERRLDVAYRLSVQGIDVDVADDFPSAVGALGEEPIEAIASYTAFQDLAAIGLGLTKAVTGADR
jgi:UDP-N-acetylmuramyl tripeptide synthase